MDANAAAVLDLFETKMQIEVPLFQQRYVWNREKHWEPLWEDISRKFTEYLEGRRDAPLHFLGAMVSRPETDTNDPGASTPGDRWPAAPDHAPDLPCSASRLLPRTGLRRYRGRNSRDSRSIAAGWLIRTSIGSRYSRRRLTEGSFGTLSRQVPAPRSSTSTRHSGKKYARKDSPRPRMVEAYLFFHDQLTEFFLGTADEAPLEAECPLSGRLDECFQALKNALQVVVIDLGGDDDAQVIFETLNARGEPLLPADLLRNFIFLRAARSAEPQEELYEEFWRPFDDDFWRVPTRQGRLSRPRSDLFLQHFLASREGREIPIGHLFVEYRHWLTARNPFATVRDELVVQLF